MAIKKVTVDLSQFDQQSVAVILVHSEQELVFRGTAIFQRDDMLGRILRIQHDDRLAGEPELILSEATWDGRIIPNQHGCRFCFVTTPQS